MKINIHKSEERAYRNYGWLECRHSFSFADYFNPVREKFGVIRVVNEERINQGAGFEMHEYKNLEIVLIPLCGTLEICWTHNESGCETISRNDICLITAGRGISYSLKNTSEEDKAELLQIWIFPPNKNADPQVQIKKNVNTTSIRQNLISFQNIPGSLRIDQKVHFSFINLKAEEKYSHLLSSDDWLLFVFVVDGSIRLNDSSQGTNSIIANERDSLEISLISDSLELEAITNSQLLIIETQPD